MGNLDFWRGRELNQFQRAMDRILDDWAGWRMPALAQVNKTNASEDFSPTCEISENKNAYLLKFDLPGLQKDQIKLDLHDNRLTVSGERKEERKEEDKEHRKHFSEVYYGSFMRSFTFPQDVDAERVEAKYENGVLTVNVAKTLGQQRSRQIPVR